MRVWPILLILALPMPGHGEPILLPGFDDVPVIEGLSEPVAVRFDRAGEVFVAEKAGRVKLFAPLPAPGPGVVVLDIRDQVMDYQDRGLLGLVLHPRYPDVPFVYVLYTYDAPPGVAAPVWNDHCDDPTGIAGGCVVSGRLARYTMVSGPDGPRLVDEQILIRDEWYQQYPSHSIGDLAFGPDGMLYVSGGEGAGYEFADFGDAGQINRTYPNPGDPAGDGGALRSQDLLTAGDALGLSGAILRVDPDTGQAGTGNPLGGVRQIAFGLRNPFRIGFRPGTRELWIGDVGESAWEEVNRIADVNDDVLENFGWPCYEGAGAHFGFEAHPRCAALIHDTLPPGTPGRKTPPFFSYLHGQAPGFDLTPAGCQSGAGQAISGISFYQGGSYPSQYQQALFFADYAVNCIYAMRVDASGVPDPTRIDVVERAAEIPVSLEVGPGGDIYYASIGGAIRRITYGALTAKATADTTSGDDPLMVQFDGSGSVDPAGGPLLYAWDLDGNGVFDDSTEVRPHRTYARGAYTVRLQVTSRTGNTAVSPPLVITAGVRPAATITAPAAGTRWKAGERLSFAGMGSDVQDGVLRPEAMSWRVILLHCPMGGCHQHPLENFAGVAAGSFTTAPDGYPAHYQIELTVTDSAGFTGTTTVQVDAIGTELRLETRPPGMQLIYAGAPLATPHQVMEVDGDTVTLEAPARQDHDGASYLFTGWSDGGDRARVLTVPDEPRTYVAIYEVDTDRDGVVDSMDPCPTSPDRTCAARGSGEGHGGCVAGGTDPGTGALAALGFALLVGLRAARRRASGSRPAAGT